MVATRHVTTPTIAEMGRLAKTKGEVARISITIIDHITPAAGSIAGNWSGMSGLYRPDSGLMEAALRQWARGKYSKTPPVHHYIYDEFFSRRSENVWPPKVPGEYATRFPTLMRQWGNLDRAILKMKHQPQFLIPHAVARPSTMGDWEVSLKIGEYFNTFPRLAGNRPGVGIDYTWIHEFGLGGFPKRDFIAPALEKAANEWHMNWEVEVEAAAKLLQESGVLIKPIISSTDPTRPSTLSSIVHHFPERHLNWVSMLIWLLPVNEYISLLAAIKDIRGAVSGGRLTFGSVQTWLQAQAMGGSGLTIKSARKSFRKKLWGG